MVEADDVETEEAEEAEAATWYHCVVEEAMYVTPAPTARDSATFAAFASSLTEPETGPG